MSCRVLPGKRAELLLQGTLADCGCEGAVPLLKFDVRRDAAVCAGCAGGFLCVLEAVRKGTGRLAPCLIGLIPLEIQNPKRLSGFDLVHPRIARPQSEVVAGGRRIERTFDEGAHKK